MPTPRKFFSEPGGVVAAAAPLHDEPGRDPLRLVPFNRPRPMIASTERLRVEKNGKADKRPTSAWQTSAWQYFDSIGELHFAFNLTGQVCSRVRLYAAVVVDADQPPVKIDYFVEPAPEEKAAQDARARVHEGEPGAEPQPGSAAYRARLEARESGVEISIPREVAAAAQELLDDLRLTSPGGSSGMLRQMAINLSVPGEFYLINHKGRWMVASTDELTQSGDRWTYRRSKTAGAGAPTAVTPAGGEQLEEGAFVARIWRPHGRYSYDPDSSMIGVLDDCELLVLLTQTLRSMTRSRMNAGVVYVPDGISSFSAGDGSTTVQDGLVRMVTESVEDETSLGTVVPLLLTGPPELGDKIKWISMGRQIDDTLTSLIDRTLQRVLQGIDIPKDMVTGLADAKYSNAIIIDEGLYRAHVEPLVLMIVDSLTTVYLRPLLRKKIPEDRLPNELLEQIVVWADTSDIVTRPDRSAAANEGYDRKILSEEAWRDVRGFSDADAPTPEERLRRVVLERGTIAPEVADQILRRVEPEFFEQARAENEELPDELDSLLSGQAETAPEETPPAESETPQPTEPGQRRVTDTVTEQQSGSPVAPGGQRPPPL